MIGPPASRVEADRLRELANVGAAEAAAVLEQLMGRAVLARPARVSDEGAPAPGESGSGVFFEAEGQLSGVVALLLPPAARDAVLWALLGQSDADPNSEAAESALRELANIVASRTVSAIANTVDARILLSLPKLVMEGAEGALASIASWRVEKHAALRIEVELCDCDESFRSLLVLVADS